MTDLETSNSSEFATALRGYDRAQVDEYIDRLERLLADAQDHARDAQAGHVFAEHAAVGSRVAEIFALAEAEARELCDRLRSQSTDLLDEARAEARAIVEEAQRNATEIRERSERDHVVMFAELEQERERIRDEVAVLERAKAEAVGELTRLRELLGQATGVVGHVAEIRGRAGAPRKFIEAADETVELPAVRTDLNDL